MQKFSADFIYPISSPPIQNGIVVTDDKGKIIEVLGPDDAAYIGASDGVKRIKGIICPGFVNTHCHLELSYLIHQLDEKKGLPHFIQQLQKIRANFKVEEITFAIANAELQMLENGIVAVGDICNGPASINQKLLSKLYYHSFVELFGFDELQADALFAKGKSLLLTFENTGLPASLAPHAPYSTSAKLMRLISNHCAATAKIMCIHNQESEAENKLFMTKSGELAEMLLRFGIDLSDWKPSDLHSLPSYFQFIKGNKRTLLVHNTFSSGNDIALANSEAVYWCFCPNANLFIENRLPEIPLFITANAQITLGTDSLASNHKLCIWNEIKTIRTYFPTISLEQLLQWGTLNGASYLGISGKYGSLEKGKVPGLNWIENPEDSNSVVKRLI
jgi:aminodeoxyfutalosine deaminase